MGYELIQHTIPEQLSCASSIWPDQTAYIFPDEGIRLTFGELKTNVDRAARALLGLGLKHGDRIGIWSLNCFAWIDLLFGAAAIGVVAVPLNSCYHYEELDDLCVRGELNALFLMERIKGQSVRKITDPFFEDGKIRKRYPQLKHVISLGEGEEPYQGWETFLKAGERIGDQQMEEAEKALKPEDDYLIQYTSGTTSRPKGAVLTQFGAMNTAKAYTHLLHMDEGDCTYVPLPLFHCFGNILTLLGGLISGSTTIYPAGFSPKQMLSVMQEERCTCMMGVPTMYFSMLATQGFDQYDLGSLTKAGIGGSACPRELCRRIADGFKVDGLIVGYGLSEAASLCTLSDIYDPEEMRIGSVGRPLPGLEVSLADESGKESPDLEEGEILVRGYGVMKGYYKDPEQTAQALDACGWLHTGDMGRRDENGIFHVVGRFKDIIIKGGENISPGSIEERLLSMEHVRECQCVGVPDAKYGEVVCACIISADETAVTLEEVRTFLDGRISEYKMPDHVLMMESFPVNGSGKVMKSELAKTAAKRLNEEE